MPRFFVAEINTDADIFRLPENAARHVQVLRSQPQDIIELFDGTGFVYTAEIASMGKKNVDVRLLTRTEHNAESPLRITLLQSISSAERMDFTIQKSVELGVFAICPIVTERSSQRLSGERADKKVARWQEIAQGACEQCGRSTVPCILPIQTFQAALSSLPDKGLRLLMSLNHAQQLPQFDAPQTVFLLVGPEGGLSYAEETIAIKYGFQAAGLGPRILRTETAALVAIAGMQILWGDLG
ncbi:16S rRNA (uracil(1498)-N(3))-methyltransferase [Stenoxybacter acetivorans]|uniref:16S rRNA (uracil(1498)-N(3))-methyltransferase n=1 Tax=Stenoxybacter acetivorans TaxID=422441 RepID=UPI0005644CDD|nr:16S rRNA (uracil(1498)-N(3))-methyltransferase [Stenoxybacter acetivorans]